MSDDDFRFAVLAEKDGYDWPLCLHSLSLTQLYEELVIPYEEGKYFFIDGVPVDRTKLRKLKITKQSRDFVAYFEALHENIRFKMRDAPSFVPIDEYLGRLAALFRESGVDVTASVVNAYQERKELKLPVPEIISGASQVVVAAIKAASS